MPGIDSRLIYLMHAEVTVLVKNVNMLIAKLASKAKASVSPYFGEKDFAFVPVLA